MTREARTSAYNRAPVEIAQQAVREKKIAALESVASSLLLVTMKVFVAATTGSLGILSEALHSTLDLVSTIVTYLSVRVADKPPDEKHPFGHLKVENVSSLIVTGLLLAASGYIIWEAFERMLFKGVHVNPSPLAFGVLALTIVVDSVRSRALMRVARRHKSEALEADALHFSTDIWSTLVVMGGIAAVWMGERTGLAWLRFTDPIAALLVSGVIIWVGARLGKQSLDALLDAAPAGLQERVTDAVNEMDGVLAAERVRVRRAGSHHFVDVTISVPRTATFEQVHATSDAVEKRVAEVVGSSGTSDVMVHMEPRAPAGENLFDAIRAIAQRRGLAIHELSAHQLNGKLFVELHLEVDENLALREAHRRATDLEEDILQEGGVGGVNIHIEPLGTHIAPAGEDKELAGAVQKYVNELLRQYTRQMNLHQVIVRNAEHRIIVSCHCGMDGSLPITQVHDITEAIQDRVKERFPQIFEVNIHPEPLEES